MHLETGQYEQNITVIVLVVFISNVYLVKQYPMKASIFLDIFMIFTTPALYSFDVTNLKCVSHVWFNLIISISMYPIALCYVSMMHVVGGLVDSWAGVWSVVYVM